MLSPVKKIAKSHYSDSSTQSIITARQILIDDFYLDSPSVLEESITDSNPKQDRSVSSLYSQGSSQEVKNLTCKCLLL